MLDDFFVRALLAAVGVALFAGPLGCFVVWRRMAYFGDTMAHSALLGVGLGFLLGIDMIVGVVSVAFAVALLLVALQRTGLTATDTLLGILSHSALSLGLILVSLMAWLRLDLMGFLFGDVLAVTAAQVGLIWAGGAVCLAGLALIWRPLLALTVSEDLARAEGVPSLRHRLAFMLLMAAVIAIAMKVVGILLITSLLIIPAAAARGLARTPEQMAVIAAATGAVAAAGGLLASLHLDTPAGPSIVVAALVLYGLSLAASPLARA
ncbi:MAG: metal ABC transporter permease [Hyphomicrobiales bacterium]|nr:metal ABC transporter permease [Hyphomicrobiales bacterium]MCP5371012.1 metal ABC transporter permease [Hyphomicrobiales bacterium]